MRYWKYVVACSIVLIGIAHLAMARFPTVHIGDGQKSGRNQFVTGTAFAVDRQGTWITARHVVDGCQKVYLAVDDKTLPSNSRYSYLIDKKTKQKKYLVPVPNIDMSDLADIALLKLPSIPSEPLPIAQESATSNTAIAVGYPAAKQGEMMVRLIGRRQGILTFGSNQIKQPILSWGIKKMNPKLFQLAGMSGGPMLNQKGEVVGVITGENLRRGRIYTSTAMSLQHILPSHIRNVSINVLEIGDESFDEYADALRQRYSVIQVFCPNKKRLENDARL